MKPLAKTFSGKGEVRGFIFTQLQGTSKAYLYQVDDEGKLHYEVFTKRINHRFGNVSYPSGKAFSKTAWCIRDFDKAVKKFNELNEEG